MLTPSRRRGHEFLDDPALDGALVVRSLHDVARANTLFGGRRAVLAAVAEALPALGPRGTLLDVGTGIGDIPYHAGRLARRRGVALQTLGLELSPALAAASAGRVGHALVGDGFRLPFADRSIDLVTCSQVAHHFAEADAVRLLRELDRVARVRVVVADLRRSWLAAGLFWCASWPLVFHPVSRHDGTLSVLRGFTAGELQSLVREAAGVEPHVTRGLGWRLTARWTPAAPSPGTGVAHAPASPARARANRSTLSPA